jgi:hypothetical protein
VVAASLREQVARAVVAGVTCDATVPDADELPHDGDVFGARKRDWTRTPKPDARGAVAHARRGKVGATLFLIGLPVAIALIVIAAVRCSRRTPNVDAPVASPVRPTPPVDAAAVVTIDQRVAAAATLQDALALARPISTTLVARYAVAKLTFAEVDAAETTLPLVEKDFRSELGKRLCVAGEVRRIERADMAGRKVFVGELLTKDGDRVTYLAVGSTGELVKRTIARFCGVVTDKLQLVGMFDLPENRAPIVEQ